MQFALEIGELCSSLFSRIYRVMYGGLLEQADQISRSYAALIKLLL